MFLHNWYDSKIQKLFNIHETNRSSFNLYDLNHKRIKHPLISVFRLKP